MSKRIGLIIASIILLGCVGIIPTSSINKVELTTNASSVKLFTGTVRLGNASFMPTTIGAQGQTANLNIGIETSVDTSV
jgi:hypothetical protein